MWDVVVIGGGITGLTTVYSLRKMAKEAGHKLRVCLVECEPRLGGKVLSERAGGFLVEGGPDSFIVQKPWALDLVRELGLENRLVAANEENRTTYIVKDGRLVALPDALQLLVPQKWGPFLRSPLLSWRAKLAAGLERWVAPRRTGGDESVADFVRRRFGEEILDGLAEPLLAHIHVGDVERMSLRATYPRLATLEERYGSLTIGLEKTFASPRRRPQSASTSPRGSAPVFLTLEGGLGVLCDRLGSYLPESCRYSGRRAERLVQKTPSGDYTVLLDDGTLLEAPTVVLAIPAFQAAPLVGSLDEGLARKLREIRYVSMATLSLGYLHRQIDHPLAGFGFFVPRREKRNVLACTWTSSKFAGRTPDDEHVLLRLFLGGARGEAVLEKDDAALIRSARQDLQDILGIRAAPVLERLFRWPLGYPQYEVDHLLRVRSIESALPEGLTIAGSAYHGVGLPDCVRSAQAAARRTLERLAERIPEVDGKALAC